MKTTEYRNTYNNICILRSNLVPILPHFCAPRVGDLWVVISLTHFPNTSLGPRRRGVEYHSYVERRVRVRCDRNRQPILFMLVRRHTYTFGRRSSNLHTHIALSLSVGEVRCFTCDMGAKRVALGHHQQMGTDCVHKFNQSTEISQNQQ